MIAYASLIPCLLLFIVCRGEKATRLELLQVLFQNGDRTPTIEERYPTDPYDDDYWQHMGYGVLTYHGKKRAYELGRVLRREYDDFLGEYSEEKVYPYSADFSSSKQTLAWVLTGVYPPGEEAQEEWSDPMPLRSFTMPHQPDRRNCFKPPRLHCRKYQKLLEHARRSAEMWRELIKYENFTACVRSETQVSYALPDNPSVAATHLLDNLRAVSSMGLERPGWCATSDCTDNLYSLASLDYDAQVQSAEMRRLFVGTTLQVLLHNIEQGGDKRIYLFSALACNLAAVARVLGMLDDVPAVPSYADALILEKLRDETDAEQVYVRARYYEAATASLLPVKMTYNSKIGKLIKCLKCTKYCKHKCPLETFRRIVKPTRPTGEDYDCAIAI
ncbi:venom acid phosphatase Acph-1-like [Trichogramma pretiosum]|uniref:venom acid phosphatase Acph-1-like n=1 Tax=Trichogramma pretiosum TaxID=7493 RepID=UPI0006C9C288|nr:venom acid phosphatase Acph-1-like [Trichogramma pretiosum]